MKGGGNTARATRRVERGCIAISQLYQLRLLPNTLTPGQEVRLQVRDGFRFVRREALDEVARWWPVAVVSNARVVTTEQEGSRSGTIARSVCAECLVPGRGRGEDGMSANKAKSARWWVVVVVVVVVDGTDGCEGGESGSGRVGDGGKRANSRLENGWGPPW